MRIPLAACRLSSSTVMKLAITIAMPLVLMGSSLIRAQEIDIEKLRGDRRHGRRDDRGTAPL